jgi:octaprenyl-diphosphate synthase
LSTTLRLIPLLEPVRSDMEAVERIVRETVVKAEQPLKCTLRDVLDGGKRLRPALVILVGRMFARSTSPFHRLAAAVEVLHTATLIHDDVVDEAPLRRGRETLNTIWPAGATVLAGDYLLAQAVSLTAELNQPRIVKVLAQTLRTMSAGEIRQAFATSGKHSRKEYYQSIEAKTSSLFAAAMEMAGMLAGAEEPQIASLRRFGREFGIAFQIVDDVLDFIGEEEELGKPAGSDIRQGLITLPTLCYLEKVKEDDTVNAVLSGQADEEHLHAVMKAICSSGAIEASLAEARAHATRSREALAALPENKPRQMLSSLTEYVVERRH